MSFAGTSVTAGHDNLFEESYPMVFARALEPVFEAAGVELHVRNHAMGNNPAVPSAFCVGAQLGEDTDVAVWEFGMMVRFEGGAVYMCTCVGGYGQRQPISPTTAPNTTQHNRWAAP